MKRYIVKWTDNKGVYHEKYYKDEASSKRAYTRKKNEKTLKTIYCEHDYYLVGDEFNDEDITINMFVRRTFMNLPLPEFEKLIENGVQII